MGDISPHPAVFSHLVAIREVAPGWHPFPAGRVQLGITAGPFGDLLFLSASQPVNERGVGLDGLPVQPHETRLRLDQLEPSGSLIGSLEFEMAGTKPPHFLQRFGTGHWLLVWAWARSKNRDSLEEQEHNARVYSSNGEQVASFYAGDGVSDVQVTKDGQIWISYFDEGILGTADYDRPNANGLVCFDSQGRTLFKFNEALPPHGLREDAHGLAPFISDCYALNVASDQETWLYYYQDFPLVKLVDRRLANVWRDMPVHGAHAFAISGNRAWFAGQYGANRREIISVVDLDGLNVEEYRAVNGHGQPIPWKRARGRGSRLWLISEDDVFFFDTAQR